MTMAGASPPPSSQTRPLAMPSRRERNLTLRALKSSRTANRVSAISAESVQFPDRHIITPAEALQHLIRLGTTGLGPTGLVVTVDAFTASSFQLPDLQFGFLVDGTGTGITQT